MMSERAQKAFCQKIEKSSDWSRSKALSFYKRFRDHYFDQLYKEAYNAHNLMLQRDKKGERRAAFKAVLKCLKKYEKAADSYDAINNYYKVGEKEQ